MYGRDKRTGHCCIPFLEQFLHGDAINLSKVKKLEIIVSNKPKDGDAVGHGRINVDHIVGIMKIPPGSPWARAEEERKMAIARI